MHEEQESEYHDEDLAWQRPPAIFVLIDVRGEAGERIREIQQRFDPRLAGLAAPHVTLIGSSGFGPIPAQTTLEEIRAKLEPIVRDTAPFTLTFGVPVRFMQTKTFVLPLDPHGPLRQLHERIGTSGLRFERARHMFTPHATLSLYRTLSRDDERGLLQLRIPEKMCIDHIKLSLTDEPNPPRDLLELPLGE